MAKNRDEVAGMPKHDDLIQACQARQGTVSWGKLSPTPGRLVSYSLVSRLYELSAPTHAFSFNDDGQNFPGCIEPMF